MIGGGDIYPSGEVLPAGSPLSAASDALIRRPLWEFRPSTRKAVLTERRRRFGIEDERIDPADLTEEDVPA
ncbi:hypothetical protein [Streptomyces sp. NPDC015414]|uniref:hypothetical protein n=1 Tax=Streptomyces sp. NPDC015414 TaxID=3364957 RepID=UPI0036F7F21C